MNNPKHQKFLAASVLTILLLGTFCSVVQASNGLSLTLTPPLIKVSMVPGDIWSSSVKIVNTNPYDLTVYASIRDFRSKEGGGVQFIKEEETEEGRNFLLSQWMEIPDTAIVIPIEQSAEVPFTIELPENAEPGGHYGAILVGTRPPEKTEGGTVIGISTLIASLIMLNVQGEIIEEGRIREFSTSKRLYTKPEVDFKFRFENMGNVHLQPVGEIKIYNFLGKERGTIPINQRNFFGNVLPQSTRQWLFEWKGEKGLEVGRYKAELVVGYGQEAHSTVSSTLYFWVIPLKPTAGILGGLILLILITTLSIRWYVRRAVAIVQREAGLTPSEPIKLKPRAWAGPLAEAVVDLRAAASAQGERKPVSFWKKYLKAIIILVIFVLLMTGLVLYLKDVAKKEKSFEIIISQEENQEITIPSEEITKESQERTIPSTEGIDKTNLSLEILNGNNIPDKTIEITLFLRREGFQVEKTGNADHLNYQRTVIRYLGDKEQEAGLINDLLGGGALLEKVEEQDIDILIIIGED